MKIVAIKLPDIGEGVTEVELDEWQVAVGDIVQEDDIIAAVMTDKASVEIPSLYSGKIVWLAGEIGESFAVGADLVRLEVEGDVAVDEDPEVRPEEESKQETPSDIPKPAKPAQPAAQTLGAAQLYAPRPEGAPVLCSPAVRRRARDNGLDLRQIEGSGPAGRITHGDLDRVFHRPTVPARHTRRRTETTEIKVVGLRRKIAERMSMANSKIPHITVVEEVDMTATEDLRAQLNKTGKGHKLTILPIIIAALAKAFETHPEMNAHFDDEAGIVTQFGAFHAGVATMTDNGLIVPVLAHAEDLSLQGIAGEITRLSEEARAGKIKREELRGSTFTISSLGPLGALATTPIINLPEVAILGVNKLRIAPHWDGTQFVPRKMMNISASFDHRVIDGWDAARFVQRIKSLLETPALIFMKD